MALALKDETTTEHNKQARDVPGLARREKNIPGKVSIMNYTKQHKLVRKTLLATAVAAIASPAMSQMALEEVIVTAQKREQSLQDIPASVAAITSESLAFTSTQNFDDLGKITSGITLTGGADGFGGTIRIRGVGNNAFAPAIRPSVGIFVNEVPLISLESAYNNLAGLLLATGRPDEAEKYYQLAADSEIDAATRHYRLGRMILKLYPDDAEKLEQAIVEFDAALAIQPRLPTAVAGKQQARQLLQRLNRN